MLLGPRLKGHSSDWRVVEKDLHDIARQVREYDADARLIREDGSGRLGLARWVASSLHGPGGYFAFVRAVHDLDTDLPLTREPDARVMRFMRSTDSRYRNLRDWHRRAQIAEWMGEKRTEDAIYEENLEKAEGFMHALKKDVSARPRTFVPRDIPKAA